jgi:hypothetical protein
MFDNRLSFNSCKKAMYQGYIHSHPTTVWNVLRYGRRRWEALKLMSTVAFWDVATCNLVDGHQHSGRIYHVNLQDYILNPSSFKAEDRDDMFF